MRLSKQLCFLVAAAIASAVDGAPIGEKLLRRQAITLDLTPTQQIDVDASRDVPTILISDSGFQVGQQANCAGGNCGSYSINMPPIGNMDSHKVYQTTYDPYAENYSPYPTYPPSRANLYAAPPPPVQSQAVNGPAPAHVSALPLPAANAPPKWTNAGWNAPLIPSGSFAESLQGTPTIPAPVTPTSTTTAPGPIPGALPQAHIPPSDSAAIGQPAAAAPLPLTAPVANTGGAAPTSLPASTASPAPVPGAEVKDEKKTAELNNTPPPPPASGQEVKTIAKEAALASSREQAESKPAPPAPAPALAPAPQRRGLRAGTSQQPSSDAIKKRGPASKRLRKRQLEETPAVAECEPTRLEKVEVLVPVTEEELAALQEESAEIVSYPSLGADGTEEKLYDVLPVTPEPVLSVPSIKNIYEEGAQKMAAEGQETLATKEVVPEERSVKEETEQSPRPRSLNAGTQDAPSFAPLEKRLKYGE